MEKRHLLIYHILCHAVRIDTGRRGEEFLHELLPVLLLRIGDAFHEPRIDEVQESGDTEV